jgi:hypothetical protein
LNPGVNSQIFTLKDIKEAQIENDFEEEAVKMSLREILTN